MTLIWVAIQLLNGDPPRQADFFKKPGLTGVNTQHDFDTPGRSPGIHRFLLDMYASYGTTMISVRYAIELEHFRNRQTTLTQFHKKKKGEKK
jgi:hypothetical protein